VSVNEVSDQPIRGYRESEEGEDNDEDEKQIDGEDEGDEDQEEDDEDDDEEEDEEEGDRFARGLRRSGASVEPCREKTLVDDKAECLVTAVENLELFLIRYAEEHMHHHHMRKWSPNEDRDSISQISSCHRVEDINKKVECLIANVGMLEARIRKIVHHRMEHMHPHAREKMIKRLSKMWGKKEHHENDEEPHGHHGMGHVRHVLSMAREVTASMRPWNQQEADHVADHVAMPPVYDRPADVSMCSGQDTDGALECVLDSIKSLELRLVMLNRWMEKEQARRHGFCKGWMLGLSSGVASLLAMFCCCHMCRRAARCRAACRRQRTQGNTPVRSNCPIARMFTCPFARACSRRASDPEREGLLFNGGEVSVVSVPTVNSAPPAPSAAPQPTIPAIYGPSPMVFPVNPASGSLFSLYPANATTPYAPTQAPVTSYTNGSQQPNASSDSGYTFAMARNQEELNFLLAMPPSEDRDRRVAYVLDAMERLRASRRSEKSPASLMD